MELSSAVWPGGAASAQAGLSLFGDLAHRRHAAFAAAATISGSHGRGRSCRPAGQRATGPGAKAVSATVLPLGGDEAGGAEWAVGARFGGPSRGRSPCRTVGEAVPAATAERYPQRKGIRSIRTNVGTGTHVNDHVAPVGGSAICAGGHGSREARRQRGGGRRGVNTGRPRGRGGIGEHGSGTA